MSEINTEKLAESLKNGDKSAADEIYRQYSEPLTKFVIKQGLSEFDAQDVVSDTFVEVIKHIDQLKDPSAFSSWIHTIAKRKAWEAKKKLSRRQDLTAGSDETDDITDQEQAIELTYARDSTDTVMLPQDYAENEKLKQIIAEQINSLSADHKEALVLFYYKDKSIAEIAELTGTNVNNVKQRLYAARKKLKAGLEKLQKSGVVLCAVPFTNLISFCAENFGNIMGTGPAESTSAVSSAKSAAAKNAEEASKSITAKTASTAAKTVSTAVRMGTGAKIAAAVIAAATVGGGAILLNRSDKPAPRRSEVRIIAEPPKVSQTSPENIWKGKYIADLTESYGSADGLMGAMFDTDGDNIPELFIYDKNSLNAPDNTDAEDKYSVSVCSLGRSANKIGTIHSVPEIWCSGAPSEDNLVRITVNEKDIWTLKAKSSEGTGFGDNIDEETAKSIYNFDTQPHMLIADETCGYREIGDFESWINSWNGNAETVEQNAPALSYSTLNVWQKSYFDYINIVSDHHDNIRCGLSDVNGDGMPELLLEYCDEVTDSGIRINNKTDLVTCDSSGERDILSAGVFPEGSKNEVYGGFTFTGTNNALFSVFPEESIEYKVVYHESIFTIENGHFEYDGRGDEFAYDKNGNIVYLNNSDPTDEDLFMKSHYGLLNSENALTTCPGSFDRQADITWFDPWHKTDLFADYESKTNNTKTEE
ncbi:RNA polymerase sigma factor [Ruminococcus flavefaciens]|uniref:RNA polymerase sigma factor n=1 Tax=Ruminococcus flavefaciens TaxID=1265 RepID=UPI00048EE941|nr:sigma-70 family RNA polymerase sigma factor [Ruminococcus flavefaciens]